MSDQNIASDQLDSSDLTRHHLGLQLDTPGKKRLLEEKILQDWEPWVGDESVKRGYPELKSREAKLAMAMLLDNQKFFQRSRELTLTDRGTVPMVQDVGTQDEALPTKFALQIVRRSYALMINADWMVTQPLPGPTGYIFYLDFIRESTAGNTLSVDYNVMYNGEFSVPVKGKLSLQRDVVTAIKQIMGTAFSLEAQEDARAQLGLDIERELLRHFGDEFARNLFARQLKAILVGAKSGVGTGTNMPAPWSAANQQHTFPDKGANSVSDYKALIYNVLINADADFQRANRTPSNGIVCGYGLAAYLQKLNTATQSQSPETQNMTSVGITDYGTYAGRWQIWATDFLPDAEGFLYRRNPDMLLAGFVYAPYVPVQVMPAIYGDYDATTGNYTNKDAWTRNIRERSAYKVTKPYAFQPMIGPPSGVNQW